MALADPQSVTINSVAQSLPRTGMSADTGSFTKSDGTLKFEVSHQNASRFRHMVKLTNRAVVSDPLVPSQNINVNYGVHLVVDLPRNGVSVADAANLAAGLAAWCTVANITKVITGES